MLNFQTSYFSVYFLDRKDAPWISEIVSMLNKSPYFKVKSVDYSPKEFWLAEFWTFSAVLTFSDKTDKEFTFILRKFDRNFSVYQKENDIFNPYIMSPRKLPFDDDFFWDLGILTDLTEDEITWLHKQFKVVATFDFSPLYRDNSAYKFGEIQKAIHLASLNTKPDIREWFMVHYVYKKLAWWNKNWLHTHGLERFWFSELEILDVPEEFIQPNLSMLNNIVLWIFENWEPEEMQKINVWWWVYAYFMPYLGALQHMSWWYFWNLKDRESHWEITSNILMTKSADLFKKYDSVAKMSQVYADDHFAYIVKDESNEIKNVSWEMIDKFWYFFEKYKDNPRYSFSVRFKHEIGKKWQEELWTNKIFLSYKLLSVKWNKLLCKEIDKCEFIDSKWDDFVHTKNVKDIVEWSIEKDNETFVADNIYKLKD